MVSKQSTLRFNPFSREFSVMSKSYIYWEINTLQGSFQSFQKHNGMWGFWV